MKKYHTPCKFLILVFFFTLFIQAYSNNYTVVNTLNSGNGSLREAITNANSHAGADTVAFNIPATDAGYNSATGTWTITLISLLPYLADMTGGLIFIDGNTQTINQGDSNIYGPEIIIHSNTSLYFCFALASPNSTIRSLIINGFANAVVFSNSTCINSTLRDMFIGIDNILKNKIDPWLKPLVSDEKGYAEVRPIHIMDMGNLIGQKIGRLTILEEYQKYVMTKQFTK